MYAVGCSSFDSTLAGSKSGCIYLFEDQASGLWTDYTTDLTVGVGRYRVPLPYGISTTRDPTSVASYGGRLYMVGGFTYNLVLDEHHRMWKQGIRGPEAAPNITGAAGTGAIAYLTWYDALTYERSPLSAGTVISTATPRTWTLPERPPDDVFTADGTVTFSAPDFTPASDAARTFYLRPGDRVLFSDAAGISYHMVTAVNPGGVIQTDQTGATTNSSKIEALPFSRSTHCELWLSVAGGLPRLVMRVPIGTPTVVESTAVGDLGEAFIGAFERFPRCTMNVVWNDRQIMAGDPDNPDTVYMSELFYPERYTGLNFRTRDGAPVTGILALRDYCLVFSRDRTYMLQGYTESDFTFTVVEQSLGSIGHQCNVVVHGAGYIWTEKGPYMFNGSWHPLSPENTFEVPSVSDSPQVRAETDPDENIFTIQGPGLDVFDRYYSYTYTSGAQLVFDYTTVQPETGGTFAPARLSIDDQILSTMNADPYYRMGSYYISNKWGFGRMYSLSHDGTISVDEHSFKVFQHATSKDYFPTVSVLPTIDNTLIITNPLLVPPDFVVVLGHYYMEDPGGNVMEGKTFKRLWLDARTYLPNSYLTLYPGDDDALEMQSKWINKIPGFSLVQNGFQFVLPMHLAGINVPIIDPQTTKATPLVDVVSTIHSIKLDNISGRGLSLFFFCPNLGNWASFRGFGGAFIEGPATRYGTLVLPE